MNWPEQSWRTGRRSVSGGGAREEGWCTEAVVGKKLRGGELARKKLHGKEGDARRRR